MIKLSGIYSEGLEFHTGEIDGRQLRIVGTRHDYEETVPFIRRVIEPEVRKNPEAWLFLVEGLPGQVSEDINVKLMDSWRTDATNDAVRMSPEELYRVYNISKGGSIVESYAKRRVGMAMLPLNTTHKEVTYLDKLAKKLKIPTDNPVVPMFHSIVAANYAKLNPEVTPLEPFQAVVLGYLQAHGSGMTETDVDDIIKGLGGWQNLDGPQKMGVEYNLRYILQETRDGSPEREQKLADIFEGLVTEANRLSGEALPGMLDHYDKSNVLAVVGKRHWDIFL